MSSPFDTAAQLAMPHDMQIGDRFRETALSGRVLKLVSVIRPYSGVPHGRLRNLARPSEIHFVSLRALGDGASYTRISDSGPGAFIPDRCAAFRA